MQLFFVILTLKLVTIDAGNVRLLLRRRLKKKTLLSTHMTTSGVLCPALGLQDKKDVNRLEQVQLRATRMVGALGQVTWEWQQRDLGLFILEERQPWRTP